MLMYIICLLLSEYVAVHHRGKQQYQITYIII